jgi:hypothetical protein
MEKNNYLIDLENAINKKNKEETIEALSLLFGNNATNSESAAILFELPENLFTILNVKDFITAIINGSFFDSVEAKPLENEYKKRYSDKMFDTKINERNKRLFYIISTLEKYGFKEEDYKQIIFDEAINSNLTTESYFCLKNYNIDVNGSHLLKSLNNFSNMRELVLKKINTNKPLKVDINLIDEEKNNFIHILSKDLLVIKLKEFKKTYKIEENDLKAMSMMKNKAGNIPLFEFLLELKRRTKKPNGPYEQITEDRISSRDYDVFFNLYSKDKVNIFEKNNDGISIKDLLESHPYWPKKFYEEINKIIVFNEKVLLEEIIQENKNDLTFNDKKNRL